MGGYIQVFVTTGTKEDAQKIGKEVLEKKLAACVQVIGPITSDYWWKGKIERSDEWLCLIKSKDFLYDQLEEAIKAAHPYEVAEIVAVPVQRGSREYLAWIDEIIVSP
ncbi:MAG: divalent-cation tolerance protein CutA [Deltaproteobacteria bacterium]|nr:divalent-cation tolerance protein CutA [Deltaproteobacteria bacterium]MBW1977574.1 divalent-cation tolerance protein CutA [Deltaproteobacteria bacterium]MBW2044017.1 divalent-cation tolerance protein CutA [Deltaproteobacteria bacterium]MBW2298781.1 divalent-cation tolerance protein CutA [Deltaproteobacteria bacterium]